MRPLLALVLVLSLAATLPAAAKEPGAGTATDLYVHLLGFGDAPMNTQMPDRAFRSDLALGMATVTASCVPSTPLAGGMAYHTFYAYSLPGRVEYGQVEEGRPVAAPQRGLAADLAFDTSTPAELHVYLSTGAGSARSDVASPPLVVPQVVVRGALRTGNAISAGNEAYEAGRLLASGTSGTATLATGLTSGAEWDVVDGIDVYHVSVPMAWAGNATVPAAEGMNLRIDVQHKVPGCDSDPDQAVMSNTVRLHTSDGHRPRLGAHVVEALRFLQPPTATRVENTTQVLVRTEVASPWGLADIATLGARADGPTGTLELSRLEVVQVDDYDAHRQAPYGRVESWVVDVAEMPPGDYVLVAEATTVQGARVVATTPFHVEAEAPVPAPAWLAAAALALAAALVRRRAA